MNFVKTFYTSAETDFGYEGLLNYLKSLARDEDWKYPGDIAYPNSELDNVQEKIKSIIYDRFYKEFPYML